MIKFCNKCNSDTKRQKNGRCSICAKIARNKWRANNPEKWKKTTALYREKNKQKISEYERLYRKNNSEKIVKRVLLWNKNNPELVRIKDANRRARMRSNNGGLTKGLVDKLYKLQKGKCPCCSKLLGNNYHLDHIIPLALGGLNIDSNIQLLRAECNMHKHAKHPIDFMQSKGFLL